MLAQHACALCVCVCVLPLEGFMAGMGPAQFVNDFGRAVRSLGIAQDSAGNHLFL